MFSKLSAILVLTAALAGSVGHAYTMEEGEKFCQSFMFSNDKMKCMTEVHSARFYETSALEVCKGLMFTNDQLNCLAKIRNKTYTDTLVSTCKEMMFTNKIVDCLAQFGTTQDYPEPVQVVVPAPSYPNYPPPVVYPEQIGNNRGLKRAIRKAMRQMDNGNFYAARQTLENAMRYAE